MFATNTFAALLAFTAPFLVRADLDAIEPAPGNSYNEGSACFTAWIGDTSSPTAWKNMAIQLMTGDNNAMVSLTTVAENQDGTVNGSFSYSCPQVTPNSDIYFYQFSSAEATSQVWTGRFTIAAADGTSTPPTNPSQPGTDDGIAWGTGALNNPSDAVAPPSFDSSGSSSSALSTSLTTNSSDSSAPVVTPVVTSSVMTPVVSSGGTGDAGSSASPVLSGIVTSVATSSIPTTSAASKSPSSEANDSTSGALGTMTGFDIRVLGAAAAATLALSFLW